MGRLLGIRSSYVISHQIYIDERNPSNVLATHKFLAVLCQTFQRALGALDIMAQLLHILVFGRCRGAWTSVLHISSCWPLGGGLYYDGSGSQKLAQSKWILNGVEL